MSFRFFGRLAPALLLIATVWMLSGSLAPAQGTGPKQLYEKLQVREALRTLFRGIAVSYTISPDLQGDVFVPLGSKLTFETNLQEILRQAGATYRIEGGVYEIFDPMLARGKSLFDPNLSYGITQDENYVYALQKGTVYKLRKSDLKVLSRMPIPQD